MPGLLDRDLTKEEEALAERLRIAARQRGTARDSAALVRHVSMNVPHMLCPAAIAVLESETDAAALRWLSAQLMEGPEFLTRLLNPDQFTRWQQIEVCRYLMKADPLFDVQLARLTPRRREEAGLVDTETAVRVLDILDHISPGPRLILLLQHLTRHADSRIASKATVLIGKRLRNEDFVARQLESPDSRVRANTMEGLWSDSGRQTRNLLWAGLKDKNNRVVGNALIGLHRSDKTAVREFVQRMIEDPRPPFRWTAAWVMGQIGAADFIASLEKARGDPDAHVREVAQRVLAAIAQPAAPLPPDQTQPAATEVPPESTAELAPSEDWDYHLDGRYHDSDTPHAPPDLQD